MRKKTVKGILAADFQTWARFQLRAIHGREVLGLIGNDCHDYAGRNPARPDLIALDNPQPN
jgi:hypothetical protein